MKRIIYVLLITVCFYACSKKSGTVSPINVTPKPDTLVTFKFGGFMMPGYIIATDENGNIISTAKRQTGTSTYVLTTPKAYPKDRVNIYELGIPADPTSIIEISGYLQIKKGGVYDQSGTPSVAANYPLNIHLSNAPIFDQLTVSTDLGGATMTSLSDTLYQLKDLSYSDNSKVYAQVIRGGHPGYHFFDIAKGTHDLNIDINQCTSIPSTVSMPASGLYTSMRVYAKTDKNQSFEYNMGTSSTFGSTVVFYYPKEAFQQYSTVINYDKLDNNQNLQYGKSVVGPAISTDINIFPATINFTGNNMSDFNVATTGTYDYYQAHFIGINSKTNLDINYWSPSIANYKNFQLPDFSAFIPKSLLNPTIMRLQDFGLYKVDGFDEKNLIYKNVESFHDVNIEQIVLHNY